MATIISTGFVLGEVAGADDGKGVLCFNNIVTPNNITATSSTLESPITSITNPATAFGWEASSNATQTITVTTNGAEVDYIGIASHNLNQIGLTLSVKYNGVIVLAAQSIADTQAILFLRGLATPTTIEIIIAGATVAPKISVLYIGKRLVLERGIYVGHTPITYGRDRVTVNGVSENGQYLGQIVVRQTNSTEVSLQNLTPTFYRTSLDPYFFASPRVPCFFAWKPDSYPAEVGYVWIEGDPRPTNQRSNGMMQVDFSFKGIA
jgi:hypothetical protein